MKKLNFTCYIKSRTLKEAEPIPHPYHDMFDKTRNHVKLLRAPTLRSAFKQAVGHNILFSCMDEAVDKYMQMKREEMENLAKQQLHLQIISDMVVDD